MKLKAQSTKLKAFKIIARPSFKMALCFVLSAFSLSSCSFNPNLQEKGEPTIQGQWLQDTSAVQQKLVTAQRYHITFDCDSFFVQIDSRSRENLGNDSCAHNGQWSEYIKGGYFMRHDTLTLKGLFCNADYSYKTKTNCFRTGPYEEFFTLSKKTDSLIQLTGASSVIPINLHLLKKTSCTPKAL